MKQEESIKPTTHRHTHTEEQNNADIKKKPEWKRAVTGQAIKLK